MLAPEIMKWALKHSEFAKLHNPNYQKRLAQDQTLLLSVQYQAMNCFLEAHEHESIEIQRSLLHKTGRKKHVQAMCEYLFQQANDPDLLYLLVCPGHETMTLKQIMHVFGGVSEIELAAKLFGENTIMPIQCLLKCLGNTIPPCSDELTKCFDRALSLFKETRQPSSKIMRTLVDKSSKEKAKKKSMVKPDVLERLESCLTKLKERCWIECLSSICYAVRNIAPEAPATMQLVLLKHCPWHLQRHACIFFDDKGRKMDPWKFFYNASRF